MPGTSARLAHPQIPVVSMQEWRELAAQQNATSSATVRMPLMIYPAGCTTAVPILCPMQPRIFELEHGVSTIYPVAVSYKNWLLSTIHLCTGNSGFTGDLFWLMMMPGKTEVSPGLF